MPQPLSDVVSYHAPTPDQITSITSIRSATQGLLDTIVANCPPSPDRSAALRKVREAMMTANASIVVDQKAVAQLNQTLVAHRG